MGGSAECKNYAQDENLENSNILFLTKPAGITFFSIVTMGYTIENLIDHLWNRSGQNANADFFEMNLHHISTIALFTCMILVNQERVGVIIAYVHLLADGPGALTKALSHLKAKLIQNTVAVVFLSCILSWMYTRNYIIPKMTLCTFEVFKMPQGYESY